MTDSTETVRAEYIAGLRVLADLLEARPEIPAPYHGRSTELAIFTSGKDELVAAARAFPGKLDKTYDDNSSAFGFELHGRLRGLRVVIYGDRNEVCRRVVTGTREVTKTVPAPDAPMVEVTETVEDVEWVCEPLLAEASS
jgi:hypothetical protein